MQIHTSIFLNIQIFLNALTAKYKNELDLHSYGNMPDFQTIQKLYGGKHVI